MGAGSTVGDTGLGIIGRKAIVCASSQGLGRACAEALAEAGCIVVLNGRDRDRLKRTAEEIRISTDASVIEAAGDISTPSGQDALIGACPDPDILINNNAGPPPSDFRRLDRTLLLAGIVQNMITPIELIQRVIAGMTGRRFGRIVNITSVSVRMPLPGLDLSAGARACLTAFLAGVAREVAPFGVTINNLLPGMFETSRLTQALEHMAATEGIDLRELRRKRLSMIPVGRFGDPREFGKICAFLCGTHAGYLTGQNILVDGGLHPSAF